MADPSAISSSVYVFGHIRSSSGTVDDLRMDLPVALHEALLGAEVTVPTLKGACRSASRPRRRTARVIRLAGQGMPRATGGHGDLFVTVKVVLPTKLSDKERELVDGARDITRR